MGGNAPRLNQIANYGDKLPNTRSSIFLEMSVRIFRLLAPVDMVLQQFAETDPRIGILRIERRGLAQ